MIKTTTWHPDTCDCVIEYIWDNATTESNRIHNFGRMVSICDDHKGIENPKHIYFQVLNENRSTGAMRHGLLQVAKLTRQVTQPDGSVVTDFKENIEIRRSFIGVDRNRKVRHQIIGVVLNVQERVIFRQAAIDFYKSVIAKEVPLEDIPVLQSVVDVNNPSIDSI